jgi:hypothetical protein
MVSYPDPFDPDYDQKIEKCYARAKDIVRKGISLIQNGCDQSTLRNWCKGLENWEIKSAYIIIKVPIDYDMLFMDYLVLNISVPRNDLERLYVAFQQDMSSRGIKPPDPSNDARERIRRHEMKTQETSDSFESSNAAMSPRVIDASNLPCPINRERLLTVITWSDGNVTKKCTANYYDKCNSLYTHGCPIRS